MKSNRKTSRGRAASNRRQQNTVEKNADTSQRHLDNGGNYSSSPQAAKSHSNHSPPMKLTNGISKGGFDSSAAEDYKWAKHRANASRDPSPMKLSSNKNIRIPTAGLVRTNSIGKSRGESSNTIHSAYHNAVTPVKRNVINPDHSTSSKQLSQSSYRTRSRSPVPFGSNRPVISAHPSAKRLSARRKPTKEEMRIKRYYEEKNYTFQTPGELVTVKSIDLTSRTAFEQVKLFKLADLQAAARNRALASTDVASTDLSSQMKKMSPSPQHLEMLEMIYNLKSTRQLCWSPSVSCEADPFYGWDDEDIEGIAASLRESKLDRKKKGNNNEADRERQRKRNLERRRRRIASERFGRYRQVNAATYVSTTLPNHYPLLTNKRRRLPMRSDVGFPNATEEEIILKQSEIAKEAELEEVSPRLIVILNSSNIGSPMRLSEEDLMSRVARDSIDYSLPNMPLAGKDLVISAYRNEKTGGIPAMEDFNAYDLKESPILKPQPNIASIFAPPIDATSSSTEIWRARPFTDRPPGMINVVIAPLELSFDAGNIEPLVCTMTLYCLPKGKPVNRVKIKGKISEDFIFPAGNWHNAIEEKARKILAEKFGIPTDPEESGGQFHKKKALFCFDPLALPASPTDPSGRDSLYIVLQIYKVTHKNATAAYVDSGSASSPIQTMNKKNKSSKLFGKSKSNYSKFNSSDSIRDSSEEKLPAEAIATIAFDEFGTQFLTPIGFGALPLFPDGQTVADDDKIQWPSGMKQSIQLFAHPTQSESEEEFVERLLHVSQQNKKSQHNVIDGFPAVTTVPSINSYDSQEGSSIEYSTSFPPSNASEDSSNSRWFSKSSRKGILTKGKKKNKQLVSVGKKGSRSSVVNGSKLLKGGAIIHSSLVGADFTPILLQNLEGENQQSNMPRLFVDATGDCAIMLNPEKSGPSLKKRSDLIRLPPSVEASGYSDSFEVREILYLPPHSDRHYDADIPTSQRTPLNLLFVYPQLIRHASGGTTDETKNETRNTAYTVRLTLVKRGQSNDERTPLESIYNPTPGSPSLLQSAYTKIPLGHTLKGGKVDLNNGINIRDEFKVRLPEILDGTHYIQFSLFSVAITDDFENENSGSVVHSFIAETFVPLSSSSTKESTSGVKVTTVIPNGLHTINIGKFQLEVETRLASTVHISDPRVATVIRDFPSTKEISRATGMDNIASFYKILSKASGQSIVNNFLILAYLHMRFFAEHKPLQIKSRRFENDVDNMCNNLKSLFEILMKARQKFSVKNSAARKHFSRFLKEFLDLFDENQFISNESKLNSDGYKLKDSSSSQSFENVWPDKSIDSEEIDLLSEEAINAIEEIIIEGALSVALQQNEAKLTRFSSGSKNINPKYLSLNNTVPFSRRAYGASKIDRMKAEAELYESGQMITEMFDDDETVITASTWHSQSRVTPSNNSISFDHQRSKILEHDRHFEGHQSTSKQTNTVHFEGDTAENDVFTSPFEKAKSIAKIFISPCVAPDTSIALHHSTSSRNRKSSILTIPPSVMDYVGEDLLKNRQEQDKGKKILPTEKKKTSANFDPGSDADEEETDVGKAKGNLTTSHFSAYPNFPKGAQLRGFKVAHLTEIKYSIFDGLQSRESSYIYETIFLLWKHSCKKKSAIEVQFIQNMDFLLPLCLKSLVLRCTSQQKSHGVIPSIVFDMEHMKILDSVVQTIAKGLISLALTDSDGQDEADRALSKALSCSDFVSDFFIGMLNVIHPSQVAWLITKYFKTLKFCEDKNHDDRGNMDNDSRNLMALTRLRCSQHLRLRGAEKLASLPQFVALNYPMKYASNPQQLPKTKPCTWTNQEIQVESQGEKLFPECQTFTDGLERFPETHWLVNLLLDECFGICSHSCELFVTGKMLEPTGNGGKNGQSSIRQRNPLPRMHTTRFSSTANHAITIVYELLIRNHALDTRYQTEDARSRMAGMFVHSIIENSVQGIHWLAKMDCTHKVRTIWLLCLLYILQEAPEIALREKIRSLCIAKPIMKQNRIFQFVLALKLSISTFQAQILGDSFGSNEPSNGGKIFPWIVQESFNTICAATILLIEDCCDLLSNSPFERNRVVEGVLDLLLRITSTPQSSVTLLRALGAASHTLEKIGASLFFEVVSDNMQHWSRVIFTLMNSTSLSVRSMAVDFAISLFGSTFEEGGNIDEVGSVFLTILPEVAAREIALYSADDHIISIESVEAALWPLRRALADVEEADPLDDNRVDAQLSPFLGQFCRACQAIIDGVLIELRLQGNNCEIAGTRVKMLRSKANKKNSKEEFPLSWAFDADEESLFEAANSFHPETSPMQRLRWLLTLRSLHERKGKWVEAAETLILCAKTIAEAIPHVKDIWRPSKYFAWRDHNHSPWLSTIGKNTKLKSHRNSHVMEFAESFLEPHSIQDWLIPSSLKDSDQLDRPTLVAFCKIVTTVSKAAISNYQKEGCLESLAYSRLENLLKIVMNFVEDRTVQSYTQTPRIQGRQSRIHSVEDNAAIRRMSAIMNELITKLAEKMLLLVEQEGASVHVSPAKKSVSTLFAARNEGLSELFYVRVVLRGKRTHRFEESTTIPTFLDWNTPYICRVPNIAVKRALESDNMQRAMNTVGPEQKIQNLFEDELCNSFAHPLLHAILEESEHSNSVQVCTEAPSEQTIMQNEDKLTYIIVTIVHGEGEILEVRDDFLQPKKFLFKRQIPDVNGVTSFTEITVAHRFPAAISRQPTIITTEYSSAIEK